MSETILIADDCRENRLVLKGILRNAGYRTIEVDGGRDAVSAAVSEEPSLVLLDVMMPVFDGHRACRLIKRIQCTRDIPIIFLSAKSSAEDKVEGLGKGANDYIAKPFDAKEVLARVQTQLKINGMQEKLKASNVRLIGERAHLEGDLGAAADLQKSLLPSKGSEIPGLSVEWRCTQSLQVGGDLFGTLDLDPSTKGLYMADVCGHGVSAAMMSMLVARSMEEVLATSSPEEVLGRLDAEFPIERFNRYFTITYLRVQPKDRVLTYSSAGHVSPILIPANGPIRELCAGGAPIGLGFGNKFEQERVSYEDGDRLFIYTDGVTEAADDRGRPFGEERLFEALHGTRKLSVRDGSALLERVFTEYRGGRSPRDDSAFMFVELGFETV
jgi:sigma-B regulation protein RsbU (phosphoserine phosphatase)